MKNKYVILATCIKYDGRSSILSVCGEAALRSFALDGNVSSYDATSAPHSLEFDLFTEYDPIDDMSDFYADVLAALSDETGLNVVSCNYSISRYSCHSN